MLSLQINHSDTSSGSVPNALQSLAALSRNASAISTSTPRPRPIRTFTGPRSRSPHSVSPRAQIPPHYLVNELGYSEDAEELRRAEAKAKARSKSRGRNAAATVDDFKFGPTLGDGSYSTVKLATHLPTGKQYAVKVIEKQHLITKKKQSTAHAERRSLMTLGSGHPGIVRMWYSFQDQWRLYFVLDLARNGEMKTLLSRMGSLSVDCARYYSALLVDILKYMHSKKVIHRDLKPENLLLDDNFRIKITDFGTGKVLESEELITGPWCVIYQMIAGRFAFVGLSDYLTFEKIKKHEYSFPDGFDENAKDLVQHLLALCSHPFFEDPVPPLAAGLLKIEHPLKDMMGIGKASYQLGTIFQRRQQTMILNGLSDPRKNVQSLQEQYISKSVATVEAHNGNGYMSSRRDTGSTIHGVERPFKPQQTRRTLSESPFSASPSSSSAEEVNLQSKMKSISLQDPDGSQLPSVDLTNHCDRPTSDSERGRKQDLTPVQGNWPHSYVDLATLIKLPLDEPVIFNTAIDARLLRRRASRLIPLPVPSSKAKSRQLVLTPKRLLCLKQQKGGDISIKSELSFRASEKLKEKDKERESRAIVSSVERKGDREFVVLTVRSLVVLS
ncbi:kinase-like domain-containing protein [Cyathus striatus]|nr:kinase-like domain-containing protein [Cyathus striatus]